MIPITIQIHHPDLAPGPVRGFRFFWAYYVTGYDQSLHCQPCFKGTLSTQLNTRTARSGVTYVMNERRSFPYLYVCGVGVGPKTVTAREKLPLASKARGRGARNTPNVQRLHSHGRERSGTSH